MKNEENINLFFETVGKWIEENGEVVIWYDYHSGLKYCDIYNDLDQLKQKIIERESSPHLTAIKEANFTLRGPVNDAFILQAQDLLIENGSSYMLLQRGKDGVFTDEAWLDTKSEVEESCKDLRGEFCAFGPFSEKGEGIEIEMDL